MELLQFKMTSPWVRAPTSGLYARIFIQLKMRPLAFRTKILHDIQKLILCSHGLKYCWFALQVTQRELSHAHTLVFGRGIGTWYVGLWFRCNGP